MARKELIFLSIDPDPDPDPAPLNRGGRGPRLAGLLPGPLRGLAMRTLLRRRCGAGPGAPGRGLRGAEHADAARDGSHGRAQQVLRPPPGLVLRQLWSPSGAARGGAVRPRAGAPAGTGLRPLGRTVKRNGGAWCNNFAMGLCVAGLQCSRALALSSAASEL